MTHTALALNPLAPCFTGRACTILGCRGSNPVKRNVMPVSHLHSSPLNVHLEHSGFSSSPICLALAQDPSTSRLLGKDNQKRTFFPSSPTIQTSCPPTCPLRFRLVLVCVCTCSTFLTAKHIKPKISPSDGGVRLILPGMVGLHYRGIYFPFTSYQSIWSILSAPQEAV